MLKYFQKALGKTGFKYTGVITTPQRADGLIIFQWHSGDICHQIKKRDDNNVNVKLINYEDENEDYSKLILNYNKTLTT